MFRYTAERFFQSLLVLLVLSFAVYGLIGLMPGDPIDLMIQGGHAQAADATKQFELLRQRAHRLRALIGLFGGCRGEEGGRHAAAGGGVAGAPTRSLQGITSDP